MEDHELQFAESEQKWDVLNMSYNPVDNEVLTMIIDSNTGRTKKLTRMPASEEFEQQMRTLSPEIFDNVKRRDRPKGIKA